jgi:hypothetical protein
LPVKLFGDWTALPAGPATLAAKTGALIAPLAIRRTPDGRFHVDNHGVFTVDASDPATIQRATQRIADFLEKAVSAAPEQWYSFKPVWPDDPAEAAELERRAAAMLEGQALPTGGAGWAGKGDRGAGEVDPAGGKGDPAGAGQGDPGAGARGASPADGAPGASPGP